MVISKQQEQSNKILYLITSSKMYKSYKLQLYYSSNTETLDFTFLDYKNKIQFLCIGMSKNILYSVYMSYYTLYYKILKGDNITNFNNILLFCKKVLKFKK